MGFIHVARYRDQWTGEEPSGSVKSGEFIYQLSDYQFLKDSAPWNYLNNLSLGCRVRVGYGSV